MSTHNLEMFGFGGEGGEEEVLEGGMFFAPESLRGGKVFSFSLFYFYFFLVNNPLKIGNICNGYLGFGSYCFITPCSFSWFFVPPPFPPLVSLSTNLRSFFIENITKSRAGRPSLPSYFFVEETEFDENCSLDPQVRKTR